MSYDYGYDDEPRGRPAQRSGGGKDHTKEAIESGKYTEVKTRLQEFYAAYPTGAVETVDIQFPVLADGLPRVMVRAKAWRVPDDPHPGTGTSWMVCPGKTPYTNGSEVENCETSAWGRAIAAVGIAIDKNIATVQEILAKSGGEVAPPSRPAQQLAAAAAQAAGATPLPDNPPDDGPGGAPVEPGPEQPTPGGPGEAEDATETAAEPEGAPGPVSEAEGQGEAKEEPSEGTEQQGLSYDEFKRLMRERLIPQGHVAAVARELKEAGSLRGDVGSLKAMTDEERLVVLLASIARLDDTPQNVKS